MKSRIFRKAAPLGVFAILTCGSIVAQATEDLSYLGENLKAPAVVLLLDDTHPVTDKLAGKVIELHYPKSQMGVRFLDGKNLAWQSISTPDREGKATPYVAFEIAENIYYVTWVNPSSHGDSDTFYDDNYLITIILDFNKMVLTESFMSPNKEGVTQLKVMQAKLVSKG